MAEISDDKELSDLLESAKELSRMAKDDGDIQLSLAFMDQVINLSNLHELRGIHSEVRWIRRIMMANVPALINFDDDQSEED